MPKEIVIRKSKKPTPQQQWVSGCLKQSRKKNAEILIDGDLLVYSIGFATQESGLFVDGSGFAAGNVSLVPTYVRRKLAAFLSLFNVNVEDYTAYRIFMSGSDNWRFSFYPEYKANRKKLSKPLCYNEIREHIMSYPNAVMVAGEEADDKLADIQTQEHGTIIVSADKDFHTVPGLFYSVTANRLFCPTRGQATCFLFFQALTGDLVDGYKGVPWIGKAKAVRILRACSNLTVREAYFKIKRIILARGNGLAAWKEFQTCLSLASLRWYGETGNRAIGLNRIRNIGRDTEFQFYLPYYDVVSNLENGVEL